MRLTAFTKTIVTIYSYLLIVLVASNSLYAATTQGIPDYFASTGTVDISVSTRGQIRIFGLQTISFGTWNIGDGNLSDNQDVCIGKSQRRLPYAIQASGDGNTTGDPSAFTLTNGVDQINYTVHWTDGGGQTSLSPGSMLFGQTATARSFIRNLRNGGLIRDQACGTGRTIPNANLEVRIPDTELSAAAGGVYSGTLTLLIIPN